MTVSKYVPFVVLYSLIPRLAKHLQPPGLAEPSHGRKRISPAAWYEAFSRVGLNYGSTFQSLTDIHAIVDCHMAESQVHMQPTKETMPHESRYVIHPAVIDSALQLAILAAHRGRASECSRGYMPVSLGQVDIWPVTPKYDGWCNWTAEATQKSTRGFTSDAVLRAEDGRTVIRASRLEFNASEHAAPAGRESQIPSPYTKMVWKPDISLLGDSGINTVYPPAELSNIGSSKLPMLEDLAFHQVIQFHSKHPEIFATEPTLPHLQRLLSWMQEKVDLALESQIPGAKQVLSYSIAERDREIKRLQSSLLKTQGPETRLMCHMYQSLPAIYRGELTGIQAAMQNDHLDGLYAHMDLFHAGNRQLSDIIALISHKNPSLKILEAGAGTASATREVLPALRGHNALYRGYDSFTFTDITTSFLATARDGLKQYHGLRYAAFNMEIDSSEQGFDSDYDMVIASNVRHTPPQLHLLS